MVRVIGTGFVAAWLAVGSAAVAGRDFAAAQSPPVPDACTVLSLDELSGAAGVRVLRPRPDTAQDGSACRFRAGAETLSVAIGRWTAADRAEFRKLLKEQGMSVEPVPGLGDEAFFWDNRIYVYAGRTHFSVTVGDAGPPADAKRRQMALGVAKALAAKAQ
jgi:hypothetical protein